MVEISNQIKQQLHEGLREYFLSHVTDRITRFEEMTRQINEVLKSNPLDTSELRFEANKQIHELIESQYFLSSRGQLKEEFPSFFYTIDGALSQLPLLERERQQREHYEAGHIDRPPIVWAKGVKRFLMKLRWVGISAINVFKKQKLAKTYAYRKVPTRYVAEYFLEYRLGQKLSELLHNSEAQLLHLLNDADTVCRELTYEAAHPLEKRSSRKSRLDLELVLENFERQKNEVKKEAYQKLDEVLHLLDAALKKVGTLELNASFFSESSNQTRIAHSEKEYSTWTNRILRNHEVVKQNWLLCHELNLFYETLKLATRKLCDRLNSKVHRHMLKQVEQVSHFLEQSKAVFAEPFSDKELLYKAVLAERSRINGHFKKELTPRATQLMLFQNLPAVTMGLQKDIDHALSLLNTSTAIVKNFDVDQKLRATDISVINPRDIVSFEYFKGIKEARNQLHNDLVAINNRVQPLLIELTNIHAYTFETAKNNYETNAATIKEIATTIEQGFERTFGKLDELRNLLVEVAEKATHELDHALSQLAKDLQQLNDSDNAFQLNVKLLEHKTKDRTRSYYQKALSLLKESWQQAVKYLKAAYNKALSIYQKTEKTLNQDGKTTIDTELQLYLKTAKSSYEKLPFIYRLLFRLEPLDDFNFYVDRPNELNALRTAFVAWQEHKYSNVLMAGPKGSGLTSLFNRFAQELPEELQINRIFPRHNISDHSELLQLLREVFNHEKFESIDQVAQYLNECGIRRVVLIDEVQRFFLRKIHGFEVLNQLQKLMRITQNQVFWIVNIGQISSYYLFKTTNINEFFAYTIKLEPLNQKRVTELIMKRHLVSGFKLVYEEGINNMSKHLKKMNRMQKQEYLSNIFFERLTKTSEGSLSLALLQWVLAINMKDKQTITVSALTPVKDILKNLDAVKVSILHALILHDGLSINELHEVVHYDPSLTRAHLASLDKDGIVLSQNDILNINPVLHWSVVDVLTKRNLIH